MEITNTKDMAAQFMNYLIFGASKTGKTVLATGLPNVLFINTEDNMSSIFGADINKIDCFSYSTMMEILVWLEGLPQDQLPDWVFIDSLTDIVKRLLREELGKTKDGRQAYGEIGQKIPDLIRRFKALRTNIVCIAQQSSIKDEITGGMIFGAGFAGKTLEQDIPYMFSAVLATRIVKGEDGADQHVIQCHPCPQYSVGVRTKFNPETGMTNPLAGFELPNLIDIHNKILT